TRPTSRSSATGATRGSRRYSRERPRFKNVSSPTACSATLKSDAPICRMGGAKRNPSKYYSVGFRRLRGYTQPTCIAWRWEKVNRKLSSLTGKDNYFEEFE